MTARRGRILAPAILVAVAIGCAPDAAPAAGSEAVEGASVPPVASTAPAPGGPPQGYYECYFHGFYGLQNSSLISFNVVGAEEYEALEERGRFRFDPAAETLTMVSGPLQERVAHLEESDGKPALVFIRDENEVDGKPTLDIGDTWCYFEPR